MMIKTFVLAACFLVGLTSGVSVPLKRKRAGWGAQANVDRVARGLGLFNDPDLAPFLDIITRKNVDGNSPGIRQVMQDSSKHKTHDKGDFFSRLMKLFTDDAGFFSQFAMKAPAPGPQKEPLKTGEVDFADFESAKGTGDREMWDKAYEVFSRLEEERYQKMSGKPGHHGPRVRADTRIDLSNYVNFQYTGPVYMGSRDELLTVIYDTGSDWLAVDTDFCPTCIQPVFNTSESATYANVSDSVINQQYGSANLYAVSATDSVALDNPPSTRLASFNFLAVSSQLGIQESFDGILGMSRQMSLPEENFQTGPLMVEQLAVAGLITREQASFYITGYEAQSFCDLGAYNAANIRDGDASKIVWLPQKPNVLFWYSAISGVLYGAPEKKRMAGTGYTSQIRFDAAPAIFDTGTSLIYVPSSIADDFMYRLTFGKRYIYTSGMFQIHCDEKDQFEDVYFVIADKLFQVAAKDYVIEMDGVCLLAFVVHTQEFWLLGDAFLMGYYSIHDNQDHANAQVGFAPHSTSTKPEIIDFPSANIEHTFESVAWEKTWIYDWYWFWQLEWLAGTPVLDSNWVYYIPGWLWVTLFGGQSVVIHAFTDLASELVG